MADRRTPGRRPPATVALRLASRRDRSAVTRDPHARVPVGISSCLLGEAVRYDGGHKRNDFLVDVLGKHFEYLPYCPEVAIGMGTPRPPIRLVGDPSRPRAVGVEDGGLDVTEDIVDYARSVVATLPRISGYVFKRGSPSCGMGRVKVDNGKGIPGGSTPGLYAGVIMRSLPLLPVEEEGRLDDPVLLDNFVERVFVYDRWQQLREGRFSAAGLVDFHTRHKLLLLSHSETHFRRLGRLTTEADSRDLEALSDEYIETLMEGLKRRATRRRHGNVLQHIMRFLERSIDAGDKAELDKVIDAYRGGTVPLGVPTKLIEHHSRRHPDDCVALRVYLNPHPPELGLRNHL